MEILRKNFFLSARDQKHCNRNEECLCWTHVDQTCLLNEFVSLRIFQQKSPKLRGKKRLKIQNIISKSYEMTTKGIVYHVMEICCCLVDKSCPALCDPMDCSLLGFSVHGTVHGILQARKLEWEAISFSRKSSPPRDQTHIS